MPRFADPRSDRHYLGVVDAIRPHPDGVVVRVLVVPGASRDEVVGCHGEAIKIRVSARPERGRANRSVVALIEAVTGGRADIVSGGRRRTKTVLVRGVSPAAVARALGG